MKNTKKNQVSKNGSLTNGFFRTLPIIAALAASGFIQPALAVDRTWFGGSGDWAITTNWTPNGVPGSGDKAIISKGSSTLSFNRAIAGLDLFGGSLGGTGNLTVSGLSTWTRGTITGAATTTFNSTLNMSGDLTKVISGGRIVNADNTAWSGNTGANKNEISFGQGTFNNNGTFTDTNAFGDRMHSSGTFNNNGTYNKQNNTLTNIDTGVDFNNSGTGTLNVQAGVFNVANTMTNAGVVNVSADAIFQSSCGGSDCFSNTGIMQGNGTIQTRINNELVNSGAINPGDSIGHLTIDGDLHQAASGVVNFELASLSSFDQLTVTDDVTLGGDIALWNLGYTPVAGDSFVVATFDDRADTTFSSLSLHGFSPNTF